MPSTQDIRKPLRIFQTGIKQSTNDSSAYILGRAVVIEIDTVGNKFNGNPPNTIRAKIFKPQVDTDNVNCTILWPFYEYSSEPIFPTEQVLCIFENESRDFGYWINKIPSNKKSFSPANEEIINSENSQAANAFGVEQSQTTTINDILQTSETFDGTIDDLSERFKKDFTFNKRPQDHVVSCKNTARIVLGNDRRNTPESGHEDGEAIDLVVGVKSENGDPTFNEDSSRIYLSSKSEPIEDLGNLNNEAVIFARSDNICLVGKKDFIIKSEDGGITIKIGRDSNVSITTNGNVEVDTMGKVNVASGEITFNGTQKLSISAPSVEITAPDVKIQGPVNVVGAVTAASVSAGSLAATSSPAISLPGSPPIDIVELKRKLDTHVHPVPVAITPVTSGPPLPV